ncbi:TPA: hypothetical protein EYP38_04435 [Candidatus Micrarchaeota archaeon]|nr:hypothetical protein [Candidatus Micrarchaeota archaeon]
MPDQTFGGDDDDSGGYVEEPKKLKDLHKYGLSPDKNIRDVFWDIMGSYAATKKPSRELAELDNDRFALVKVAVTVLENPQSQHYGLSPLFVARYSMMMMLDADWNDSFGEFLEGCKESRGRAATHILSSFKYLWRETEYQPKIIEYFRSMLRSRRGAPTALHFTARLKNRELIQGLKRELVILARGDVGENQMNAIAALALLSADPDVIKTLQVLLAHWDSEVRRLAATCLLAHKGENDVKLTAQKRLMAEQNEDVKKILKKLAK